MNYVVKLAVQIFTGEGDENYEVLYQGTFFNIIETKYNEVVVVCFGTRTIKEQIDNFKFKLITDDGFPAGWKIASDVITNKLLELELSPNYAVGYSRGGAIAMIYSYYTGVQAIVFSPPKVCKVLRTWPVSPLIFYCMDDIVINIPPGFYYPSNFCTKILRRGGHFWEKGKYLNDV